MLPELDKEGLMKVCVSESSWSKISLADSRKIVLWGAKISPSLMIEWAIKMTSP